MHFRMLVTIPKEEAKTSEEAREYTQNYLEENNFCSEGRFAMAFSDWFVIGGRWSGELQEKTIDLPKELRKQYKELKESLFISQDFIDKNKKGIQKIWENLGGEGENYYTRDNYEHLGFEDDAKLLNKNLYKLYLKEYEKKAEEGIHEEEGQIYWIDTDYRELNKDIIDNSWLIVVDYHN